MSTGVTLCLEAAERAQRIAATSRRKAVRKRYERFANEYLELATALSGRIATHHSVEQRAGALRRFAVRIAITRLKMMVFTVPLAFLSGTGIEVTQYLATGQTAADTWNASMSEETREEVAEIPHHLKRLKDELLREVNEIRQGRMPQRNYSQL